MMTYRRFCVECGADISHRGIAAKWCEECVKRRNYKSYHRSENEYPDLAAPHEVNPQCLQCEYFAKSTRTCDYLGKTGHSRLSLHLAEYRAAPDKAAFLHSLNDPCREFKPMRKKGGAARAVE